MSPGTLLQNFMNNTNSAFVPSVPSQVESDTGSNGIPGCPAVAKTGSILRSTRSSAFKAGQMFHNAMVAACDLTLSGRPSVARELREVMFPALLSEVSEMSPSAADRVECEFRLWFSDLVGWLDGIDHIERLQYEQRALDALTGSDREDFDLQAHRDRFLRNTHRLFDRGRAIVVQELTEAATAAFRLGELIASATLPLNVPAEDVGHPARPEPESSFTSFSVQVVDSRDRDRKLELTEPPRFPFDRAWPGTWLGRLRSAWTACGLPHPEDMLQLDETVVPVTSDEKQRFVESVETFAIRLLETSDRPTLSLMDRLRIIDEGAQTISLDGRLFVIESKPAFLLPAARPMNRFRSLQL